MLIALGGSAVVRGVREWRKHREFVARLAARRCPLCHQPYGTGGRAQRTMAGVELDPEQWQVTCPHCQRASLIVEGEEAGSETAA